MNQILGNQVKIQDIPTSSIKKMKFIFWISLFTIFLCLIFYFFLKYNAWQKEKMAKNLVNQFGIQNLYSNTTEYTAEKIAINLEKENPFVIGLLKIDKINLMYPILSSSSEELLKISPCRFYGPMPNEIGNLCIAGHNYANQKHFGKLSSLESGDILQIYDLNGISIDYVVYQKLEVAADDISCISQAVDDKKEVTLVTCNTLKGTRIVIKAKENR